MAETSIEVEILVRENGPYRVKGPVRLVDGDGKPYYVSKGLCSFAAAGAPPTSRSAPGVMRARDSKPRPALVTDIELDAIRAGDRRYLCAFPRVELGGTHDPDPLDVMAWSREDAAV